MVAARLTDFDEDIFLRDYWQKRPLLMRNALPGFETAFESSPQSNSTSTSKPIFSAKELVAQAQHASTPSRCFFLDHSSGAQGEACVETGPFEIDFETLPKSDWTLLVQSLETVSDGCWDLADIFSFLPRARIDDVMASYAVPGGGIGPHFDLYDVFIVQGMGQRRWRFCETPLDESFDEEASGPFEFDADHDVEVGPGDILYLPPRVLHHGISLTPSIAYSVGGAAPRYRDLVGEFLAFLGGELAEIGGMYSDPDPEVLAQRGQLPPKLVKDAMNLFARLPNDPGTVETFLGRLVTAPKPHTAFVEALAPDDDDLRMKLAGSGVLKLAPASRLLHDGGTTLFMNGLAFELDGDVSAFHALADFRFVRLPASLSLDHMPLLQDWLEAGYVIFAEEGGNEICDE